MDSLSTFFYRPSSLPQQPMSSVVAPQPPGSSSHSGGKTAIRTELGLPPDAHVYMSPQTLYKMSPLYDQALKGILMADPFGWLVLLKGKQRQWQAILDARFRRCFYLWVPYTAMTSL
jgi:hypothetical protein